MHDDDYYDLDDGDGVGRCVECGDPAYLCECRGYDDYDPERDDFDDPVDTPDDYEGDRYVGGGASRDLYPHMSDRDHQDCRDAGRVI